MPRNKVLHLAGNVKNPIVNAGILVTPILFPFYLFDFKKIIIMVKRYRKNLIICMILI